MPRDAPVMIQSMLIIVDAEGFSWNILPTSCGWIFSLLGTSSRKSAAFVPPRGYFFPVVRSPRPPARQPERRRLDGERRRDEILDAALHCFSARGVLGVGIEDIRRRAGASPSSVYNLFADLDGIMLALLIRVFDRLLAAIAARVSRTRTAGGAVRALVDAHLEWIADHPAEGRFMYQAMTLEGASLPARARQQLAAAKAVGLQPIVAHLARFVARGELPAWPAPLLDVVLLGPAHEALRRWLAGGSEFDPTQLRRLLPALAWDSLQGTHAPKRRRPSRRHSA